MEDFSKWNYLEKNVRNKISYYLNILFKMNDIKSILFYFKL